MGADSKRLRFSWKLQCPDTLRAQYQSAYQIVIFDDAENIIFDTGKVESRSQIFNYHTVEKLKSGTKYSYRVRVWDQEKICSEYSEKAYFITGIFDKSEWKAEFISAKGIMGIVENIDTVWYRKQFCISQKPRMALAHIACVGIHELYINGKKVGERVMAPSRSALGNYKKTLSVTYDITDYLSEAENTVGIWADGGWTRQSGVSPAVMVMLELKNGDKSDFIASDGSWECKKSNISHIGGNYDWFNFGGERVEYIAANDWAKPNSDSECWNKVRVEKIDTVISNDLLSGDYVLCEIQPVSITKNDGGYLIDMGKNYTGWVEIKFDGGKSGDIVEILTADKSTEEMSFNQKSEFVFTCPAGVFRNKFNYAAGRFITLKYSSECIKPVSVKGLMIGNKFEKTAEFSSSLELQNQIYAMDINTFTANTIDGVTSDCPHRERLGYGETGISNTWGIGLHNFDVTAYYRQVFRNWRDVQHENGYLPHVTPNFGGGGGITWGSSLTITLDDYFSCTHDTEELKDNFKAVCGWADYLIKNTVDGILQCPEEEASGLGFLGDWAYFEGNDLKGTETADFFNNCVAVYAIDKTAGFARKLGREDLFLSYSAAREKMRSAIHKKYFNAEKKVYFEGQQRYAAVALCAGIASDLDRQQVINNFVLYMNEKKYMDGGSAGTVFIFRALGESIGNEKLLYRWLQSTQCPSYGYFIKNGYNTLPEVWDIGDFAGGSRIHTCFSGVAGWYTRYLAGITPDEDINAMKIKPFIPDDMDWLETSNDYGFGALATKWSKNGATVDYNLSVPANMTVTLKAPEGYLIKVNGEYLDNMVIGSGMYNFTFAKSNME